MKSNHAFLIIANHVSGAEKRFFNAFRAAGDARLFANERLVSLYEKNGQLAAEDPCKQRIMVLKESAFTHAMHRMFYGKKGWQKIFILVQRINLIVSFLLHRKEIKNYSSIHAVLDGVRYLPFLRMLHPRIQCFASVVDPTLAFSNHPSRLFGLRNCNRIDALNPNIKKELLRLGYAEDKISVTPHSFTDYSKINPAEKIPQICFCARLIPPKNPMLFLEMAEAYGQDNPHEQVEFILMGEGPLKETLLTKINSSPYLKQHVKATGYVSTPANTFSNSLIFVQLSDTEIHATQSMLEAMGAACYIIAAELEGLENTLKPCFGEMLPKNALLLSERLHYLLTHFEETKEKGRNARNYAMENFGVENFLRYLSSMYAREAQVPENPVFGKALTAALFQ